jgi:hypothetical protein
VTVPVVYRDPEPNGLAAMIGGLIGGNLNAHPERGAAVLGGPPATFGISVPDIGVTVSVRLSSGGVQVANGLVGRPDVRIEADSETLLGLSAVPLRFGLPDVSTPKGREVVRTILTGKLKLGGAMLHAGKLARLSKLLSVS